ncbi:MAG: translation initiation factor IF-3 [Pirellulaceae bacterium]|nr:translation initiation factor IF-3 [Pirellulaceae bacterium]
MIADNGDQLGVVSSRKALEIARESDLDLVEVAPNAKPPVCRIMDYGKYRFQLSQKNKKNTTTHRTKLKQVRIRPKIGEHDIEFKIKQAANFLKHRDKVQILLDFKGRENAHIDEGQRVLDTFVAKLEEYGKVEVPPNRQGRRITCTIAPR